MDKFWLTYDLYVKKFHKKYTQNVFLYPLKLYDLIIRGCTIKVQDGFINHKYRCMLVDMIRQILISIYTLFLTYISNLTVIGPVVSEMKYHIKKGTLKF